MPGNKGGGRPKNIAYESLEHGLVAGSKLIRKLLENALKDDNLTPDQIDKLTATCAKYTLGEKRIVEVDISTYAPATVNALRKTCEQFEIPFTMEFAQAFSQYLNGELESL